MRVINLTHGAGNGVDKACLMTASNMLIGRPVFLRRLNSASTCNACVGHNKYGTFQVGGPCLRHPAVASKNFLITIGDRIEPTCSSFSHVTATEIARRRARPFAG